MADNPLSRGEIKMHEYEQEHKHEYEQEHKHETNEQHPDPDVVMCDATQGCGVGVGVEAPVADVVPGDAGDTDTAHDGDTGSTDTESEDSDDGDDEEDEEDDNA